MSLSTTIERYLKQSNVPYNLVSHPRAVTSLKTAGSAHIDASRLAKAVLLEDDNRYMLAVLPASRHVKLGKLRHELGRDVRMATEGEVAELFKDCDPGAIPALGAAYGVEMIWDDSLLEQPELYFEAGDHERLVQMKTEDYRKLVGNLWHGQFTVPMA
jgi:Ala-tRNA(Pro) deacylase